jgi:hypothetical protein
MTKFILAKEALQPRKDFPALPKVQLRPSERSYLETVVDSQSLLLLHATQPSNLTSILKEGLIPRSSHEFRKLKAASINDGFRSGHGAVCFSIGWLNTKTLRSWGPIGKFVALEIDASIILKKSWFAFHTNSSAKECSDKFAERPSAFCGRVALERLFLPTSLTNMGRTIVRGELGLGPTLPNDPQAEFVIDEVIEPWWINRVIFPTAATLSEFKDSAAFNPKGPELVCDPRSFGPRIDWATWSRGERVLMRPPGKAVD